MKTLPFFLFLPLFFCSLISNAQTTYETKKDSVLKISGYETVGRYSKTDFDNKLKTGQIKLHTGDQYEDSTWYKKHFLSKEDYNSKYNFEIYMMPGLDYTLYVPKKSDSIGYYSGVSVEFLFYGQVHNTNTPGPCQVKFYGRIGVLGNSHENVPVMLNYDLGLTLSFEKNPKRNFLVPNFGMEAGGFSQKQLGTHFIITPLAGLQLISTKTIFAGVNFGYLYPFTNFEALRGYFAQASVDISLW